MAETSRLHRPICEVLRTQAVASSPGRNPESIRSKLAMSKNASAVVERDGVHRRAPDDRQSDAPVAGLRSQLSASTDKAAIRVGPSLH
jgi:hypothetical protein